MICHIELDIYYLWIEASIYNEIKECLVKTEWETDVNNPPTCSRTQYIKNGHSNF